MSEAIEKLKALANKIPHEVTCAQHHWDCLRCQLESLIPALEAERARRRSEEMARLTPDEIKGAVEWDRQNPGSPLANYIHTIDALEAEIAELTDKMACGHERRFWHDFGPGTHEATGIKVPAIWKCALCQIDDMHKAHQQDIIERQLAHQREIQAFLEPMACGHPKACWVATPDNPSGEECKECRSIGLSHCSDPIHCGGMKPQGHCTACERERLAVAAALTDVLDIALRYRHGPLAGVDLEQAILSLIPASDASLLDQHDAETWDQALEKSLEIYERAFEDNWVVQDTIDAIRALKKGTA